MRYLSEELNVFNILTAYNAVVSHIEGSRKYNKGLCIIVVDTVKRNINIKNFENNNHAQAASVYVESEKYCAENKGCEVAMVSVSSISGVEKCISSIFLRY